MNLCEVSCRLKSNVKTAIGVVKISRVSPSDSVPPFNVPSKPRILIRGSQSNLGGAVNALLEELEVVDF